ncbi:Gfo/Idh/MocA family oxidoreductase [Halogeometricum borinquense]|uniref:Gfo/Idh/MocA family oxidoreductase n=1 Tax=Halogeometricum borinquense TaxID=60847 RepID=A0A482SZS6_9EURY|nr:Gfo/Idh/MocA family oxidoreductase [Halogeometricum borinquense]RYJ08066.1 Gfo/Idh/MocA family oxidoreductase [Halogeometricum borinquense]
MTVRLGICSTAHVNAEVYAALLSKLSDVELVGISDENVDRGRRRASAVGTKAMSRSELMRSVEGVVICSPTAIHGELFDLALVHDVAVLTEKPLATSLSEAKRLRDRCDESGIVAGMAMPVRCSRPMIRLKRAYEDGTLGDVVAVSGVNRGRMPGGWFTNPELAGGGAVMDHTDHIIDVVRWITNEEVEDVYAELDTRFYDIPVEDVNLLSMTLSNGASFVLDGSWSTPLKNPFWGDARVEFVGTDGTLSADCFGQRCTHVQDTKQDRSVESIYWGADPNIELLRDFAESVRTGRQPQTTLSDAVATVAVMEAAYESAERGEPVEVDTSVI